MLTVHRHFVLLLIGYFVLASAYAIVTPAWQAPDEPAHYNYVRQLAEGDLPRMEQGDYDQAYQGEVISSRFAPEHELTAFSYEDYQPPLYYLLLTPAFLLSDGAVVALRLVSVLLGGGVVVFAYLIGRNLFPAHPHLALTLTAFVAFLPQHLAILASVNNDALAELLVATMLYQLSAFNPQPSTSLAHSNLQSPISNLQSPISLSLLLGLAFLTKVTAYLMAGVIGITLLWQFWDDWRGLWRNGVRIFLPATLIGLLWWGRNLIVYGGTDFLGTQAHDAVVVGQPTATEWMARHGVDGWLWMFGRTTFHSFWGQFGWMSSPFSMRFYYVLGFLSLLVTIGFVLAWRRSKPLSNYQTIVLGALLLLNLTLLITYNLLFVQFQGRYLFVSLIPLGAFVAIGSGAWLPRRSLAPLLPLTMTLGLISLNLYALWRIIPCLAYAACQ